MPTPQTLIEKIVQRHAVGQSAGRGVRAGDFVTVRPRHVMTHDNTAAVIKKFAAIGARRISDPTQPVFVLDHDIQNESEANLAKYATIKAFAAEQGLAFYPAGRGIGHQVMIEEGFVLPGTLVVASDSHSNMYGALGALGTPVVRTDAAGIWATGTTWWQVPGIARVTLTGEVPVGVTGKDVILALCDAFSNDEVLNHCIEFAGPGVTTLDMDARLTIANMTTEWGALAGVFPCDDVTRVYLVERVAALGRHRPGGPRVTAEQLATVLRDAPHADADAHYARDLCFDLSAVGPCVAGPDTVKRVTPLPALAAERIRIDKAYLMSCVNGRTADFEAAAAVLSGRRVADGVQLFIAAASSEVEAEVYASGAWERLLAAGATPLPPGCGACIGLGAGTLAAGEVGLSATNRNFKGRMGDRDAAVYLASPAVVAASAVAGYIASPESLDGTASPVAVGADGGWHRTAECVVHALDRATEDVPLIAGFPERVAGELLYLPVDNLNTDGIFGKDHTYREDLSPEEMAAVVFANYDPGFGACGRAGDLLIAGANFGCGSSREQAATAIQHSGIRLIIAESFSQTYQRNAFNNGFIVIECPPLVVRLRERFAGDGRLTIRTGVSAEVDFARGVIAAEGDVLPFAPLGQTAQELIVAGGLEALIRRQIVTS
jgi:homoaconitate hydratase